MGRCVAADVLVLQTAQLLSVQLAAALGDAHVAAVALLVDAQHLRLATCAPSTHHQSGLPHLHKYIYTKVTYILSV